MDRKRHGDVILQKMKLTKTPSFQKRVKSLTIAEGEHTGHHHTAFGLGSAEIVSLTQLAEGSAANDMETMMFKVEGGNAILRHEEHNPILLTPTAEDEVYVRTIQKEYDPFAKTMQRVRD
jgi:hypothetical protein